jgi:hypothetical protein
LEQAGHGYSFFFFPKIRLRYESIRKENKNEYKRLVYFRFDGTDSANE